MKCKKETNMYHLLISQPTNTKGLTVKEVVHRISSIYGMDPSKRLVRQVETALRRGVDFGILVKTRNRYKFDPETALINSLRRFLRRRNLRRVSQRPLKAPSKRQLLKATRNNRINKRSSNNRKANCSGNKNSNKAASKSTTKCTTRAGTRVRQRVPRPTVPPPPDWTQKPRNLKSESFTKAIKRRRRTTVNPSCPQFAAEEMPSDTNVSDPSAP